MKTSRPDPVSVPGLNTILLNKSRMKGLRSSVPLRDIPEMIGGPRPYSPRLHSQAVPGSRRLSERPFLRASFSIAGKRQAGIFPLAFQL
jgi:hypothetical protein